MKIMAKIKNRCFFEIIEIIISEFLRDIHLNGYNGCRLRIDGLVV